jgi:hypothetical protein
MKERKRAKVLPLRCLPWLSVAFLFFPSLSVAAPNPTLIRIGDAAAVSGKVSATAPGAKKARDIKNGQPLYLNDNVTTDGNGHLQVILLDSTVFTLGPNTNMILDTYVYDPATNAGEMAATVAKGFFRYIAGKITPKNGENLKINLPVGTIGIRGTIIESTIECLSAYDCESDVLVIEAKRPPCIDNSAGDLKCILPGQGLHLAIGQPSRMIFQDEFRALTKKLNGQLSPPKNSCQ